MGLEISATVCVHVLTIKQLGMVFFLFESAIFFLTLLFITYISIWNWSNTVNI